jgi:hypothetical protein
VSSDPRLADMTVLILAARRRLATRQVPDWRQCEGLSSLLAAAGARPRRDPWDMPGLDGSGLAQLLAEARQWQQERPHGA